MVTANFFVHLKQLYLHLTYMCFPHSELTVHVFLVFYNLSL